MLPIRERRVLDALKPDRSYTPTAKILSGTAGISESMVRRALRDLGRLGLVEMAGTDIRGAALWRRSDPREMEMVAGIRKVMTRHGFANPSAWRLEVLDYLTVFLDYLEERDREDRPMWARWLARMVPIARNRYERTEVGWQRGFLPSPRAGERGSEINALLIGVDPLLFNRSDLNMGRTLTPAALVWMGPDGSHRDTGGSGWMARVRLSLSPRIHDGQILQSAFVRHAIRTVAIGPYATVEEG